MVELFIVIKQKIVYDRSTLIPYIVKCFKKFITLMSNHWSNQFKDVSLLCSNFNVVFCFNTYCNVKGQSGYPVRIFKMKTDQICVLIFLNRLNVLHP